MSDWSSDVGSSDLRGGDPQRTREAHVSREGEDRPGVADGAHREGAYRPAGRSLRHARRWRRLAGALHREAAAGRRAMTGAAVPAAKLEAVTHRYGTIEREGVG